MSERDDIVEQAYHAPPLPPSAAVLAAAEAAGMKRGDSFSYDNRFTARLAKMQAQVEDFHLAMGQPVAQRARPLPEDRKAVRIELIREEFIDELLPALADDDLVETADAAIDILYVTFGLLVEMGLNAEVLFDEVQRSNMSKLGADGKPIIAGADDPDGTFEGRVKKGPNYSKPDLLSLIVSGAADRERGMPA
jgi:predicted HAD superfamily Cof-like phosphohydrolase